MEGDLDEGAPYEIILAAGKMKGAEDDVGLFVILSCERKADWLFSIFASSFLKTRNICFIQ
jgi:hypothetical protein